MDESKLKIDTFRCTTSVTEPNNAVRITHIPTGIVVICKTEKALHLNKRKALKELELILVKRLQKKEQI